MNEKVVQIDSQRSSFEDIEHANAEVAKIFPGFSQRLNELIDMSSLDIPKGWGRQMALSSIVKTSKMATGYWLQERQAAKSVYTAKYRGISDRSYRKEGQSTQSRGVA